VSGGGSHRPARPSATLETERNGRRGPHTGEANTDRSRMAWQGIEGHDDVVAGLARVAARGRLAGSFLFIGPPGVGKGLFAQRLAQALTCRAATADLIPCGRCGSCMQAQAGTHPDIDVVRKPEDRQTIPLESFIGDAAHRMREGLCWRLLLQPLVATRKVAIILDADHLSTEAANCLLKTLEEPPAGAVIILVGTSLERQLPTIRSRCRVVRFGPLPVATVRDILARERAAVGDGSADEILGAAAAAAGGSLDRARLLVDPDVAAFRQRLAELLAARPPRGVDLARDTLALVESAGTEAARRRQRLRLVLEAAIDWYRDQLRIATADGSPGDADEPLEGLHHTLAALAAVDRNANLSVVIDAWTSLLEEPRLRAGR
jgi:DNA polymerase-3 subunit delta'